MAGKSKTYEAAQERLNAYIKQKKLRASMVRKAVLEKVCLIKQPFTAEQLIEACEEEFISDATIYNALNLVVAANILQTVKRQRGQTAVEYELTYSSHSKMQIVCLECGRVTNVRDKILEQQIKEYKYYNFTPYRISMTLYGVCKHCRKPKREQ
jgi:Fe2+ or Zn2+ uptake regulation protein